MTKKIGTALVAAFALSTWIGIAGAADTAAEQNGTRIEQLAHQSLADHPDTEVTIITVEYAPGASTPVHEHPGYTYAYVLEGAVTSKLDNGEEHTYTKGQMWSESPRQHHTVSKNASSAAPAKFLVVFIAPHGQPLTTMLPGK